MTSSTTLALLMELKDVSSLLTLLLDHFQKGFDAHA